LRFVEADAAAEKPRHAERVGQTCAIDTQKSCGISASVLI
jgi:hypothetical protein